MPVTGLLGHRDLYARLMAELRARPSHAYLFAGPQGVGKALVAEALVHGFVCERSSEGEFCCRPERCAMREGTGGARRRAKTEAAETCDCCPACVQTALGVHPDVLHVRRAPNRTDVLIEQVRDLIARLGVKPVRAPMRLAILDDAETLNVPAQNALLKTLEEPPGGSLIFVVSASERALLDTVRSRLRMVRFGPLSPADIEAILVARIGADPARAGALARLARGSAARAIALTEAGAPPLEELLGALGEAGKFDFARAWALAGEHFAGRQQALENFELIARLLEEILCYKLLGSELPADAPEIAALMKKVGGSFSTAALVRTIGAATGAHGAVDAMANPRAQAEQFWVSAAEAARGE
jgi:DNA polymerase III subunit delta'